MSSLSTVPVEVIRQEAAALHRFLADNLWGMKLRRVRLGEDASPLVGAFWEEIGWDDQLSDDVGPPKRAAGVREVQRLLADYQRSGSPLKSSDLPARYRLVIPDSDGVGFAIADESGGELDPPVLGLSADEGTVEPDGESYLRLAAFQLIYAVLNRWYHAVVEAEPPLAALAPDRPFPHLAPGARRLSEDLWLFPREADSPDPTDRIAIRSFDGLWRWLAGANAPKRVRISDLPGASRRLDVSADALRASTAGWHEVEGIPPGASYRLGSMGEAPVIIELGDPSWLVCSRRHEQAVAAEAAARGWVSPGR